MPAPKQPAPKPNAVSPAPEPRSAVALWLLAALLTCWSFGFTTMMGSDLWWHLASGRWIWETRTLNFKDPWSFTFHGQPWLNNEWLSDVIFHAWSRALGMETLVWWKWSVLVGAFGLLFLTLRRLWNSWPASYVGTVLAIAVGAPFFDVRPQLYSVLGFVIVLRLALLPSRLSWLLPVWFFLWANLHGGFFFGLLVLTTIFVVARVAGKAPRNALPLWLACVVACLLNPNGPDVYAVPIGYALHPNFALLRVGEWKPLWAPGGIRCALYYPSIGVFALSAVAVFFVGLHRKNPRLTFTNLGLGLLTLVLSLKSRRFIPLFGIAQCLTLAPLLGRLVGWMGEALGQRFPQLQVPGPWRFLAPVLAVGLGVFLIAPYPRSSSAFLYLTSQDSFPVEALNVAESNHLKGKVFAFYEWGGYVDLRTDGRLQVYIDGRGGMVFDERTYLRYTRVLGMTPGWEKIVEDSGADYFLWPKRHQQQLEILRKSGQWRTLYADHVAALFIRADLQRPEPLLPSPDSAWRELTLGWRANAAKNLPEAEQHFARALDLMPNLRMACEWLANVQARREHLAEAEATLGRCERLFPDKARRQQLLAIFRSRAETPP